MRKSTRSVDRTQKPSPEVVSQQRQQVAGRPLPPLREEDFKHAGKLGSNIRISLEALWANRLRSLLTTLGIFIGVAAVIAALTLTQGVTASVTSTVSSLGTNVITILNGSGSNGRGPFANASNVQSLTPQDAASLQKIEHVTGVSPIVSVTTTAVYLNQNWNTSVQGVSSAYQTIQSWSVAEGSWFNASDEQSARSVALIGQTVLHNLFDASGDDPIGKSIRIGSQSFRVVGVLATKGGFGTADNTIIVPYTTALDRLNSSSYVNDIQIQVDSTANIETAQQAIISILQRRHRIAAGNPNDFNIINSNQLLQSTNQITGLLTVLLVGIAGISLTVGGIGIMNIMIVSVTERTREIGIRMSIGARRTDIRNQFLIEALTLSLLGGLIGLLIGLLLGYGITSLTGLPFIVSATSLILPFAVSATIGVTFGLYPALRASRLDPIEALRSL
jgi:putative ABC transport system permease protein